MGPGPAQVASARDPLSPPPFNGTGNPMQWVRRVTKWERIHDALCEKNLKQGVPKFLRGYLLAEALSGTAYQTVESTLSEEVLSSDEGVHAIIRLLIKFNPTTHAHEIFMSFKALMQIRRKHNESFKLYVNRFEAAASQLRGLTSQAADGAAEQFLAFQLLEGAQVPTAVFMQVLASCTTDAMPGSNQEPQYASSQAAAELQKLVEELSVEQGENIAAALPGVEDNKTAAAVLVHLEALRKTGERLASIVKDLKKATLAKGATPFGTIEGYGEITVSLESAKKALRGLDAVTSTNRGQQGNVDHGNRSTQHTYLTSKTPVRSRARSSIPRKPKGMSYERWIATRKANTKCMDCGKRGHWAGDTACAKARKSQGSAITSVAEKGQASSRSSAQNLADSFFD